MVKENSRQDEFIILNSQFIGRVPGTGTLFYFIYFLTLHSHYVEMKNLLLFFFVFTTSLCHAQETGCFKSKPDNDIELQTDIDFSRYNTFFVGEFHGVYGVSEIKLALIKYLNKNNGITDIFMEIGYSAAWLYNKYLQTGDTSFFTAPFLTYAQKQPNRDFWKKLYAYNQGLDRKIRIHGMDFERMDFIKALKLLKPAEKDKPWQIRETMFYIDTVTMASVNADINDKEHPGEVFNKIYDSIKHDIQVNRDVYLRYYGAAFYEVEKIMLNESTFEKYKERNETMYKNMMKETEEYGITRFIVFCGLNHADMSNKKKATLCYKLMNNPDYTNSQANITMVCKNCYDWQLQPKYQHSDFRAPGTYSDDTAMLNEMYKYNFNKSCKYSILPCSTVQDKNVQLFSHYLILMKDQPEF